MDSFLSKYDNNGNYISTINWGGDAFDAAEKLKIDSRNNIFISGNFYMTVDLNPGVAVAEHTSHNGFRYSNDAYILKLNSLGVYQWSKSWGAAYGFAFALDSFGNIYAGGMAASGVDYDPASGIDVINSSGAFLSKLNSNGVYQWARVWDAFSVNCIAANPNNQIFVSGTYLAQPTDFNPGSAVEMRDGSTDGRCFLSTFE